MMVIAACFYSPDDYKKLLEISDDRDSMCDTYEEWMVEFMKMKQGLEKQHFSVTPVHINLDKLAEFCEANKLANTGDARSKYASRLAKQQDTIDKAIKSKANNNWGPLLN